MTAIGGTKTIIVQEGKEAEFEALFAELRAIVLKDTGNIYYDLYKSRMIPRGYVVLEKYADATSWQAHQDAEYGKDYFPKIRAMLESIEVEYFDAV
jgi:quinol monooxygenase YgiN